MPTPRLRGRVARPVSRGVRPLCGLRHGAPAAQCTRKRRARLSTFAEHAVGATKAGKPDRAELGRAEQAASFASSTPSTSAASTQSRRAPRLLPPWPASTCRHWQVARSHRRPVPSAEQVAASRPATSMATALTPAVCPLSTPMHSPFSSSHSRAVPSAELVSSSASSCARRGAQLFARLLRACGLAHGLPAAPTSGHLILSSASTQQPSGDLSCDSIHSPSTGEQPARSSIFANAATAPRYARLLLMHT